MKKTDAFRRAAALMAALSITVSLAAPAFAGTYYIDDGDIIITKDENGRQTVKRSESDTSEIEDNGEIIITTREQTITTQESDLEGPAAEDTGFGPVVEENYQPAQPEDAEEPKDADRPEDAEEPKDADQPESAEEPKSADRQESAEEQESAGPQPQQAAPAAAPAASTPVNKKENGFWGNTITVINNFANTVLNLTLKDVKIDVSHTGKENYIDPIAGKAALSVQGSGDVEIELDGKNELKSGHFRAGLEKNAYAGTLTLKDDNQKAGSLTATGGSYSAGIGGSYWGSGENITINGGTVTATGSYYSAGIGGGENGSGKNITINGGTVTATGGSQGAGIGGGSGGSGENITINSGTVTAAGGSYGAGIGGGYLGDYNSGNGGKDITINGGTVTATGGYWSAGIGGGGISMYDGCTNGENITINGGTVTATGGDRGAGIGGGSGSIDSGGGGYGSGKDITINGGTVIAAGGKEAAGIGGGDSGSSENITITGGTVTAKGGEFGAGIGGGRDGSGETITINDGTVTAAGGSLGAGIGGGESGSGSNVTVSGAAQVTATAGKSNGSYGAGATIGNGGSMTDEGDPADGEEIQADISRVTTGYIHHIIYDPALVSEDNPLGIVREWWEPERPQPNPENPQPNPEDPNAPAEESNEVDLGTPWLHVETLEGAPLPFDAQQQGSTLRVTSNTLAARLHGIRQALEALREQGVEQIQFVTSFKTTTLPVAELLAEGGSWFALEHNGLVSRQLSAAQAESLKCRMR